MTILGMPASLRKYLLYVFIPYIFTFGHFIPFMAMPTARAHHALDQRSSHAGVLWIPAEGSERAAGFSQETGAQEAIKRRGPPLGAPVPSTSR